MIIDSSGNNHIITRHGDKRLRSLMSGRMFMGASGVGGDDETAYSFTRDGTDRLTIPSHSDWDFGTGDWTVDFWMRTIDSAVTNELTIGCGTALGTSDWVLYINKSSFGAVFDDWGVNKRLGSWPANWVDLAWMHIAIVRDSDTMRYFINGVSQGTSALSTSYSIPNNSYELRIGNLDFSSWSDDWGGNLDELRISNTARWTSGFTVPTERYTSDANTKLLIHGNEAYTGALTDETTQSCYRLDGTGDYLDAGNHADWTLGTGEFTYEMLIKFDDVSSSQMLISQKVDGSNQIYMNFTTGGTLGFVADIGGTTLANYTGSWSPSVGVWYHVAVCRDNDGTDGIEIYVDGVSLSPTEWNAIDGNNITDLAANLLIGTRASAQYVNGTIAEVKISDTCRYPSGTTFTPETTRWSSDGNTLLLIHGDETKTGTTGSGATFTDSGNTGHTVTENANAVAENGGTFTDSGGTGHTVTENGNARRVGNEPLSGITGDQSWYSFDGTGDYLSIPDSSVWDFSTGAWTIELWMNLSTLTGTQGLISTFKYGANGWHLRYTSNTIRMRNTTGGTDFDAYTSYTGINEWHHVAAVRSGNTVTVYVDGVAGTTGDATGVDCAGQDAGVAIGRLYSDATSFNYTGSMAEIRVSNTARYTTDFTPPTERYTSDSNTKLLIHGDESKSPFADDDNIIVYSFDGTGDYLSVADSSDWAFGTSDFTFEAWMKFDGMGAWYYLFTQWADSSNLMYMAKENTDKFSIYFEDSGGVVGAYLMTSAWSGNAGQWYHIAFQRRDGASPEGEIYIDGVLQTLTEQNAFGANDWADISAPLLIGERGDVTGAEFTGTMAEVRVSNIARYTGNFTPETERYTSDSNTKLLIHGDETKTGTTGSGATFTDSGGTGHTVTENGNAVAENGGTFTDSGGTGHTVTENGNAKAFEGKFYKF